jgi:hypothetical protein
MMNSELRISLVGMPSTGKTTFLAAFWNLIQEPTVEACVRLRCLPRAAVYLHEIHQAWLHGQEVGHTSRDSGELILLDIDLGGREVVLEVPDLSGESFEDMFVHRRVTQEVDVILTAADGLLLFLHPHELRPRITLVDAIRMGIQPEVPGDQDELLALDLKKLPAEVQAVDLLQTITSRRLWARAELSSPRIGVIVSAWDLVEAEGLPPARWLGARMPLLNQYLAASLPTESVRIYGLSARGGSADASELATFDPATRAFLVDSAGVRTGDISTPLQWIATGA